MGIGDSFGKLGKKELAEAPPPDHVDLIVSQDAGSVIKNAKELAGLLQGKGHKITAEGVGSTRQLLDLLEARKKAGTPMPTDIVLDVAGDGGVFAAATIIKWLDINVPHSPLPAINFLSMELDMAIDAACDLRRNDDRILAGAIDYLELGWTVDQLKDGKHLRWPDLPHTITLRELLSGRLGCSLPMDQDEDPFYVNKLGNMDAITANQVFKSWKKGEISTQQVIEQMRDYAVALSQSLRDGFYAQSDESASDLHSDAAFYGATGFARKGCVVFSQEEAEHVADVTGNEPILIMRGYDPDIVPLLASGKLGGLVVESSFMASHLKMLCETYMVTGLFGVMPKGQKTLTHHFNEEARPTAPAYFDGDTITINGQEIRCGQDVLVGLGGNGMMFDPPDSVATPENNTEEIDSLDRIKAKGLQECFEDYFEKRSMPVHSVKANIDSANGYLLWEVDGIGLVRTEQLIMADRYAVDDLRGILLKDSDEAYESFLSENAIIYKPILEKLDDDQPVRMRLFDFVHSEVLNQTDQKRFLEIYPRLDIHGGEALKTWPRLYREQVATIFDALKRANICGKTPVEIMMPAIRTVADVWAIKKIIEKEAEKEGIEPSQYSFGIMVETLECCKNIAEIVPLVDFISFGTNDLTQQHTGMDRGDLKAHAKFERNNGYNPFTTLSPDVLRIVRETTAHGRKANPALKVDICGAQAADADTAMSLFDAGIDNISVAPSMANLYGLPLLLGYRLYDAAQKAPSRKPKPAAKAGLEK